MRCPFCGNTDTAVKDSRPSEDHLAIRRRRSCPSCGGRFTTFERIQMREMIVVKRNGGRMDFDRDKLERSVRIALRKRPVESQKVDQMISGIIRRLESLNQDEIKTDQVGKTVMEALAELDPVAYIRFASVYKDFQDAHDFGDFLSQLRPPQND